MQDFHVAMQSERGIAAAHARLRVRSIGSGPAIDQTIGLLDSAELTDTAPTSPDAVRNIPTGVGTLGSARLWDRGVKTPHLFLSGRMSACRKMHGIVPANRDFSGTRHGCLGP